MSVGEADGTVLIVLHSSRRDTDALFGDDRTIAIDNSTIREVVLALVFGCTLVIKAVELWRRLQISYTPPILNDDVFIAHTVHEDKLHSCN